MMKFEQVERKIVQPPAAHNVARLLDPDSRERTVVNIARFAVSIPAFNYLPALSVIKDRVAMGLNLETGIKTVQKCGAPGGRENNEALVRAFFDHDATRKYSEARAVENFPGQFRISRDISVPTKATFTVLENEKQVPVVICGWKRFPLAPQQIRAWLSMLNDGLFSVTDYIHSPWEVVVYAKEDQSDSDGRVPHIIRPGDYPLFNQRELRELAAMYSQAQKEAMPIARELWQRREERRKEKSVDQPSVNTPHYDDGSQTEMFAIGETDS